MSKRDSRRNFIKTTAAVGAGFWVAGGVRAKASLSANEEIRFACIGIGGKGSSDSADAAANGKVVAICDIDDQRFEGADQKFPGAKKYNDFRKMLEEMGDSIDAVTVSTPDHTHAVAALMAMRMGKHCFCQKPLTHSIEEARIMGEVARSNGLVTQMGNQGTALTNLRLSAALIKNGAVGTVKEVHIWTNRPVWPQSFNLKVEEMETPPANVHWDLWLGPAKKRNYSPEIHPFKWRGFWDYGTGALGDMACHTVNMSYMALNLRNPTSVESVNDEHDGVMYPKSSKIKFEFPELDGRPALTMYWYDGGRMPEEELINDLPKRKDENGNESIYDSAALIVGENGKFFSPGDYGGEVRDTGVVVDGEFTNQRELREQAEGKYERSPGHFIEFANAIRGEGTPMSNFPDYAGPLSETILLGNLAVWSGKKVDWNAADMLAADASEEVNRMIRHEYHNGYSIK
ncbi:MAG: Gfo/Idh/MocA family oxidoreductase [Pirellulaceae bacterium]